MLQIIEQNPYRILGISSDSSNETASLIADILYKSPGGSSEAALDLPGLKPIHRDEKTLEAAIDAIRTAKDCRYRFFWFIYTPEMAGNISTNTGDLNSSLTPLLNAPGVIGEHNIIVSFLLKKNYSSAISFAEKLFNDPRYASTCLGNPKLTPVEIKVAFAIALFSDGNADKEVNWKEEGFDSWKSYLHEELGRNFSQIVDNNIKTAKSEIQPSQIDSYKAAVWDLNPALKTLSIMTWYVGKDNHYFQQTGTKLCNVVFSWANHYVTNSQDPFRYKNVCAHVLGLYANCPNQQLDYYADARGSDMTDAANFLLSHEQCVQLGVFEDSILEAITSPNVNSKMFKAFLVKRQPSINQMLRQLGQVPAKRRFVDYVRKSALLVAEKDLESPFRKPVEDISELLNTIETSFVGFFWKPELQNRKKKIKDKLDALIGTTSTTPEKESIRPKPDHKVNTEERKDNAQSVKTEDNGSAKWILIASFALILIELIAVLAWNPVVMLNIALIFGMGYIIARIFFASKVSEKGQVFLSLFAIVQAVALVIGCAIF